ncbi:MAG: SDR family NAD(P)-dependent oxidoreductase [Chloroflexota bacterium]|nr:MAG: NAD(P)-dependent oxidoreductase [Chloroflexota bacterium]
MTKEQRLAQTVALVTGAGRGIGRAIALRFAAEGAAVAALDRDGEAAAATAGEISAGGGHALALQADIADQAQVQAAVSRVVERFGRLDILVNNAAVSAAGDFIDGPYDAWDRVVQINLYGAIHCARAAAREMIRAGRGGRIVNISSIHSTRAEPGASSYDIAKGGVDQLTRALAVELAPHGIRVNSIAPGFISTSMSIGPDGVNELETDWFRDIYVARRKIPLARPGQPEEVAAAALFLASEESSYITGAVLAVDGGLSVTF